jgi:hypothetical protein
MVSESGQPESKIFKAIRLATAVPQFPDPTTVTFILTDLQVVADRHADMI